MSRKARREEQRKYGKKIVPLQESGLRNLEKNHLYMGALGAVVALIAITVGLIFFYAEPVVARVNGVRITAEDVRLGVQEAENMLAWEYTGMFPEDYVIDYDREFRYGVSFGRAVREEAVRIAALTKLMEDYASRNDIPLRGNESPAQVTAEVMFDITSRPELFADFEHHMPAGSLPGEDVANDILARARAGEDFDMLIAAYGEDPGMQANPDGYTFTSGVMVAEFEQATRELAIGEISDLVPTQFGFHIIKRVEPNPDNLMGEYVPGEELLGAKHILISGEGPSREELMHDAIMLGFEEKLAAADLVFLNRLDNVSLGN